jgi:hypothetical protein
MKTKSILLGLFALSILFTSCNKNEDIFPSHNNVYPSKDITTVNHTISGYSQLDVSDRFNVFVTFSDTEENIQIEANSNLQQYITCKKVSNQLVIYFADNVNIKTGNAVLNVYITTKQLNAFYSAGAISIQLQNELVCSDLTIDLSGVSTLRGTIYADQIKSKLEGTSKLDIGGSSNSFDINAAGVNEVVGYDFETNYLSSDLEGVCNVHLTVQQKLEVKASGVCNVYYKGDGIVSYQNLSGASKIQKVG